MAFKTLLNSFCSPSGLSHLACSLSPPNSGCFSTFPSLPTSWLLHGPVPLSRKLFLALPSELRSGQLLTPCLSQHLLSVLAAFPSAIPCVCLCFLSVPPHPQAQRGWDCACLMNCYISRA